MGQGTPRSPWAATQLAGELAFSVADFADLLLRAATAAARRGFGAQVDLAAALRVAALPEHSPLIPAALRLLQRQGRVTDLVARPDSGLLLTVTRHDGEGSARPMQ